MAKDQKAKNGEEVTVSALSIETLVAEPLVGNWLSIEGAQTHCSVAIQCEGTAESHQLMYGAAKGHAEALPQMVDRILRFAEISPKALSGIVVCVGPGAFTGLRISVALAQGLAYAWAIPVICVPALAALSYVAAVPSLARAKLANATNKGSVRPSLSLCAFDARMGELYVGGYAFLADDVMCDTSTGPSNCAPGASENSDLQRPKLQAQEACLQWRAWLADSLMTPSALMSPEVLLSRLGQLNKIGPDDTPCSLTLVGSGASYLEALPAVYSGGVTHVARVLTAADLIRFASEQPHLAPAVEATALAPVYLRNAVATPPARLQQKS